MIADMKPLPSGNIEYEGREYSYGEALLLLALSRLETLMKTTYRRLNTAEWAHLSAACEDERADSVACKFKCPQEGRYVMTVPEVWTATVPLWGRFPGSGAVVVGLADLREALRRQGIVARPSGGTELLYRATGPDEGILVTVPSCLSDEEKQRRLDDHLS